MRAFASADIAALERTIRRGHGAPCRTQAMVLRALLDRFGAGQAVDMPNLSEIARALGMSRQMVSAAVQALVRKKVVRLRPIAATPPAHARVVKQMTLEPPEPYQMALPFAVRIGAAVDGHYG